MSEAIGKADGGARYLNENEILQYLTRHEAAGLCMRLFLTRISMYWWPQDNRSD